MILARRDPSIRQEHGQALVEFALVVPIFLLILFGLIEVGRVIYLNNAFNEAAREGARYGSVEQWQYDCPSSVKHVDRVDCTEQVTRGRVAGAPASFEVEVTCKRLGAGGPAAGPPCSTNDLLMVTVKTPPSGPDAFRFLTPIIGQLVPGPVISGQAQVVIQ